MQIDVIPAAALSADDAAAWRVIQAAEPGFDSPYLRPEWAAAVARAGGPDAGRAQVAVLRRDGVAQGFLAARVGRFTAGPVGAPLCDVQALVARADLTLEPAALARAFRVGRLDLCNFADPQARFATGVKARVEALRIEVAGGFDAYADALRAAGGGILQDAAKKRRKLEREHGPAIFTAGSASIADLATLIAWKRAQYAATGQTDIFATGWPLTLLEQLHARPDTDFGGRLFTLHVGGQLIAAHYALRGGGVLHAWFIAHMEDFGRYSPGVLLIVDILRWAQGAGVRALDLGPGDYRFKQSLANVRIALAQGFVGRASPAAAFRGAAWAVRQAAETRAPARWAALPGKAMRRLDLERALRG